ncbi:MAG: hypothetical protein CM15mV57_060 [uncultured marine virus]|nr:MAG: hypothetical protein CM15mV57_060 [uncultured marine virus]
MEFPVRCTNFTRNHRKRWKHIYGKEGVPRIMPTDDCVKVKHPVLVIRCHPTSCNRCGVSSNGTKLDRPDEGIIGEPCKVDGCLTVCVEGEDRCHDYSVNRMIEGLFAPGENCRFWWDKLYNTGYSF